MGNIPLSLNCFCPANKEEDEEITNMKNILKNMEYKDIPNIINRLTELESNNKKLTDLDYKLGRLEDKIDIRFEMLFLNLKIQDNKNSRNI